MSLFRYSTLNDPFYNFFDGLRQELYSSSNNKEIESLITPPIDIHQNDNSYELAMSVPGATKDEISIDFDKDSNELSITGEIPEHTTALIDDDDDDLLEMGDNDIGELVYSERSKGKFSRSLRLPQDVDGFHIKADFTDGILHMNIPKKSESSKKKGNVHKVNLVGKKNK